MGGSYRKARDSPSDIRKEKGMDEKNEVWFDSFEVSVGPLGCKLSLTLGNYDPRTPSKRTTAEAYTSVESLKSMAFILTRVIKTKEREGGISYPIPNKLLNEWNTAPEDWEAFWK